MSNGMPYRIWAFGLPVGAAGGEHTGVAEGLTINNKGAIATVTDGLAVRQSILLLLATRPGERVMRPDYGCWLHRLVFGPNDAGTAGLAMHYVREALERWETRAEITQLSAGSDLNGTGNPGVLDIILEYRVSRTGWEERLALGYDLRDASLMTLGVGPSDSSGMNASSTGGTDV